MLKLETIAFIITLLSFCFSMLAAVWKVSSSVSTMKTDLKELVINVKHDLELKGAKLESLDDKLVLSLNGLKEKFEHFSTRSRNEQSASHHRVQDIEEFLSKKMGFERRR